MVLPVAATAVLVTNGLLDHADTAKQADQAARLAPVVQASGQLVEGLQDERAKAALLLASPSAGQTRAEGAYDEARSAVTTAAADYTARRTAVGEVPADLLITLDRIDSGLRTLPDLRTAIATSKVAFTDATRGYDAIVENLLRLRDRAAQVAVDPALNQRMRAAAAIARGKEHLSQERVTVLQGYYSAGLLNPNLKTRFIAAQTGWTQAMEAFSANATEDEMNQFKDTVTGSKLREAAAFAGWVAASMPASGDLSGAPFNIDIWDSALFNNGTLVRQVERQLDSAVVDGAATARDDGKRQALVEAGVPLAILLLAILLAVFVARSMTRSRRDPSDGAVVADGPVDPDRPLATTASSNRG
ncbi:hypothetical protein Afe04nite_10520 [Asanoa ferruginea]|nr:hypothetical protein Afe04nite_10520 [Asanoa ferruginea]